MAKLMVKIKSIFSGKEKNNKKEKESDEGREEWGNGIDFFLSALGYAVGVGNVWRFPYLCYKNGGGVFLIPYFICMVVLGIPLVYLEFIAGQFTSKGPIKSWRMVRIAGGIGFSMNIANSFLVMFYNMIIAYSLYFLVLSLTSKLPWQDCDPKFASPNCIDDFDPGRYRHTFCKAEAQFKCDVKGSINFGRCFNSTETIINGTIASCENFDQNNTIGFWKAAFPSQDYWRNVILQQSSSIDESGKIVWQLTVALLIAYFIVYLMMIKGIKVSGKLVWFTALFPYVVLLILGIRGWLLPGADIGIKFYVVPDWSKLGEIGVWIDASTQIFFTLSASYGGMATLASYNKFDHNILRDAILIPLANCITSFFAGFVIFSYLGYLSHITHTPVGEVIQAGQGLAYVVYPYAVTTIPAAPFWAVLFFIMMVLLGIDSTLSSIEVTIASIMDSFPFFEKTKLRRYLTITAIFVFFYICGLIFCLQSGTYWIEFFNNYAGDWAVLLVGAYECICISYFYGLKNLRNDIRIMIGPRYTDNFTYYIWCALWAFLTPVVCIVVTLISFTKIQKLELNGEKFPDWTLMLGQMMTVSVILAIIIYNCYAVIDVLFIHKKALSSLIEPDFKSFVPKKQKNQRLVRIYRNIERPDDEIDENVTNGGIKLEKSTNLAKDVDRF